MKPNLTLVGDWATTCKNIAFRHDTESVIMNFEGSKKIIKNKKLKKAGPIIENLNFPKIKNCILNLANNHFMDYGLENAKKNINEMKKKKIKYFGFGKNLQTSRNELILKINKYKIAIIGCNEPQFGVSKINKGGVAEIGPWIIEKINQLKKKCDYIIVSVHGGLETSPWPIPETRDLYRSWIIAGANIVQGHHSHIPQAWEKYKDGHIFYGLGNFCVDPDKWKDHKNNIWSLGVDLFFKKKIKVKINYFEIKKNKINEIVIQSPNIKKNYNDYFKVINSNFKSEKQLEKIWNEFSLQLFEFFGKKYMNWNKKSLKNQFKSIIKIFLKKKENDKNYLYYYHMIALESHRLMLKNATSILCGESTNKTNAKVKKLIREYCYF